MCLALNVLLIKNVTLMTVAFHHPVAFPVAGGQACSACRPRQQLHQLQGRSSGCKTIRMVRAASDGASRQMSGRISPGELEELKCSLWNPAIQKDWESFYRTVQVRGWCDQYERRVESFLSINARLLSFENRLNGLTTPRTSREKFRSTSQHRSSEMDPGALTEEARGLSTYWMAMDTS